MRKPDSEPSPRKTRSAAEEIFRKHVLELSNVLLSPKCHRTIEFTIHWQLALLQFLRREARRKKRSKIYPLLCESLLKEAGGKQAGSLHKMKEKELAAFEQMLDSIVKGFAGEDSIPGSMDPEAF